MVACGMCSRMRGRYLTSTYSSVSVRPFKFEMEKSVFGLYDKALRVGTVMNKLQSWVKDLHATYLIVDGQVVIIDHQSSDIQVWNRSAVLCPSRSCHGHVPNLRGEWQICTPW